MGEGTADSEPSRVARRQIRGGGSDLVQRRTAQEMRVRQLWLAFRGHDAQRYASLVRHARVRPSGEGARVLSRTTIGDETTARPPLLSERDRRARRVCARRSPAGIINASERRLRRVRALQMLRDDLWIRLEPVGDAHELAILDLPDLDP